MALQKCRECQTLISTTADKCPSCGAKPKKKTSMFTWLVALVMVVIIYNSISGPDVSPGSSAAVTASQGAQLDQAANIPPPAVTEKPPTTQWVETSYKDGMTDESVKVLTLRSINSVSFGFPYNVSGGSHLSMSIRKGSKTFDALLKIDRGQMLCGYSDCGFVLRVGDAAPKRWTGLNSSTHNSDLMFVRDEKAFEKVVKAGGKVRIGIDFYQAGQQTFEFDVSGYPGK